MIQLHRVHFVGDLLSELWALEVSQTGMCTAFASAARWYLMTESNMTLSRAGCTCFNSRCYQRLQGHCWHRESSLKAPHTTTIAAYLQCPEEPHETRGTGVFKIITDRPSQIFISTTYCVTLDSFLNFSDFQAPLNNSITILSHNLWKLFEFIRNFLVQCLTIES